LRMTHPVIELLSSDPGILLFAAIGLAVTGWSIVRDTRSQRIEREIAMSDEVVEFPRAA